MCMLCIYALQSGVCIESYPYILRINPIRSKSVNILAFVHRISHFGSVELSIFSASVERFSNVSMSPNLWRLKRKHRPMLWHVPRRKKSSLLLKMALNIFFTRETWTLTGRLFSSEKFTAVSNAFDARLWPKSKGLQCLQRQVVCWWQGILRPQSWTNGSWK